MKIIQYKNHYYNRIAKDILNLFLKKKELNVLISGGSTIKKILKNFKIRDDNKFKINLYLVDERYTQKNVNTNFNSISKILKKIDPDSYYFKLFSYKYDKNINLSIQKYSQLLKNVRKFDLSLISLATDGHVASISKDNLSNPFFKKKNLIYLDNFQKRPKKRVTLTLRKIIKSKKKILLIDSKSKFSLFKKFDLIRHFNKFDIYTK